MDAKERERERRSARSAETRTPPEDLALHLEKAIEEWAKDDLPILNDREKVRKAFRENGRVLMEAQTGSGKSTAAPVLLLQELLKVNPQARIVISQPRRIATENNSGYVATKIGNQYVDYRHKHHAPREADARIIYTVEQSLLKDIIEDPALHQYDAVILDELHERSVKIDIIMPLLKRAQKLREQEGHPLKLILTSATINKEKMLAYFEGTKSLEVPGRMYPVTAEFSKNHIEPDDIMEEAAKKAAYAINVAKDPGDILIFMPGREEIEKTIKYLNEQIKDPNVLLIPLLGGEDTTEDYKQKTNKRKIIVATNVAETSITIDTVRVVIDSGLMRTTQYNEETNVTELVTVPHTQTNALQRKGRAGRRSPGKAYFLFTEEEFNERPVELQPEILRTNLAEQVLQMKSIGIDDIQHFDFMDHPGKDKIDKAINVLQSLGALDKDGKITEIGTKMAEIEADPHFARMIVEAQKRGCENAVALLVGILSNNKSIYDGKFKPDDRKFTHKYAKFIDPTSDFLTMLNIWNDYTKHNESKEQRTQWTLENGIKTYPLYSASNERRDLIRNKQFRQEPVDLSPESARAISLSILSGLTDAVLVHSLIDGTYRLQDGKRSGIEINSKSALKDSRPPLIVSGNITSRISDVVSGNKEHDTSKDKMYAGMNMAITEEDLREIAPYLEFVMKKEESAAAEAKPEAPKPEETKSSVKEEETPAIKPPSPPSTPPNGNGHRPEVSLSFKAEKPLHRNVFQRINQLAKRFGESVSAFLKRLRKFLFGK